MKYLSRLPYYRRMTISGEMTKRDQWSYWFMDCLACLLFSGAGLGFFLYVIHSIGVPSDRGLHIAAISAFPILGVIGLGLLVWEDRHTIVEFLCDDGALRFRRLGNGETEMRSLSDIANLEVRLSRDGKEAGCSVVFSDGTRAYAPFGGQLSNAPELAEWLRVHSPAV